MHRIDASAENAGAYAFAENLGDHADQRRVEGFQLLRAAHMPRAVAVFIVEQNDEVGVFGKVVEGALDKLADGLFGRQSLQIQLMLLGADLLINPFKDREVERILVAEIVINELLVDARPRSDLVDASPGQSTPGKLAPRGHQQFLPRGGRIATSGRCSRCSSFGHFQPNS